MLSQNKMFRISFSGRLLSLIMVVLAAGVSLKTLAQDKIYKTDKTVIQAKVLKIGDENIEYKKFSNQNGPTYVVPVSQVSSIVYQNGEKEMFGNKPEIQATTPKKSSYGSISLQNARNLLLNDQPDQAVAVYAQLYANDTANVQLTSEYAYALALNGLYDASTMYLDRLRSIGTSDTEVLFFASQVFALMQNYDVAGELWKKSDSDNVPKWIAAKAPYLLQKHTGKTNEKDPLSKKVLVSDFKRANNMASQYSYYQSMALFDKITTQYPGEYLPFVGYGIVLSKLGFYQLSADKLDKAAALLKAKPDATSQNMLASLNTQIETVNKQIALQNKMKNDKSQFVENTQAYHPQFLAYGGVTVGSSMVSCSFRFGYFIANQMNISFDGGLTSFTGSADNSTNYNFGLTTYARYHVLMAGVGLVAAIPQSGSAAYYYKGSIGVSFMHKRSSLDIFLDMKYKIKLKETDADYSIFSISVGQSIYFGNRKK